MRIGIITFHHNNNFGAALQCFALRSVLVEMGHDVSVINYIPPEVIPLKIWSGWGVRSRHFLKQIRQRLLKLRHEKRATEIFSQFRKKYFSMTNSCASDAEVEVIAKDFDAIISGSDQVWVFDRSPHYFLKLTDSFKGLRISYAACCGHDRQNINRISEVGEWLSKFNWISVRNDFSAQIVKKIVDIPFEVVADPTLLIDFGAFQKKRQLPYEKYILVYFLSEDNGGIRKGIIECIKEKIGNLPIVAIVANSCPRRCPGAHHIFDASPEEWVWLFSHASYIFTDSFHGALFAVKFHRPFLAIYTERWRSLRLLDIASRYGFENHLAHNLADALEKVREGSTDYSRSDKMIGKHVAESLHFLRKALG